MPPVVGSVNSKVRDVHVVPLPGALVIGQVSPLDQVVVRPLLVHTDRTTQTVRVCSTVAPVPRNFSSKFGTCG